MIKKLGYKLQMGFAALLVTVLVLGAMLSVALSITAITLGEYKILKNVVLSSQTYYSTEAGIEDAVYRIKKVKNILPGYVLTVGDGTVDVSVNSPNQNSKIVTALSNVGNFSRKIEARLSIEKIEPEFFYGAQAGILGIEMENNSRIEGTGGIAGNIYSNGSIVGSPGATITGNVLVAGSASLDNVIIFGDAYANTITDSKICGNAYYQTIDSSSLNFLNNPSNPTCSDPLTPGNANPESPDLPLRNMPVSDSNINQWKLESTEGGVHEGDFIVNSNLTYGPKKIDGNLIMTANNKILTVAGTIYVAGYLDISNGSAIHCSASYGQNSCVVVVDGWIHISNNGNFGGSGEQGSYIMILSTSPCDSSQSAGCTHHNAAMDLHNNAAGAIFYANDGLIFLHNGVEVSEITAKKINLEPGAVVRYEQGLADARFSAGPGASWQVVNWEEIE